jgi:hypothetical protein
MTNRQQAIVGWNAFNRSAQFKSFKPFNRFAPFNPFCLKHRELEMRDECWSEAIAVGSLAFVEKIKNGLGSRAMHREVEQFDGTHALGEQK